MPDYVSQPPWEFLRSASPFSLRSYELSRLNHAANLRKEISRLIDQWPEENAFALLARLLVEIDDRPGHGAKPGDLCAEPAVQLSPASHNVLQDSVRAAVLRAQSD